MTHGAEDEAFSLFLHGDQRWADPLISRLYSDFHTLLDRSPLNALAPLASLCAVSPSFATLVLHRTGGSFFDSADGRRLAWLLKRRESDLVALREIFHFSAPQVGQPMPDPLDLSALAFIASHPLVKRSIRVFYTPACALSSREQSGLFEILSHLKKLERLPRLTLLKNDPPSRAHALSALKNSFSTIRKHQGLKSLRIAGEGFTDSLLSRFSACSKLASLSLQAVPLKNDLLATLPALASSLTQLKVALNLPTPVFRSFSRLTNLRSLSLEKTEDLYGRSEIGPSLLGLTKLTDLRLSAHRIGSSAVPLPSGLSAHLPFSLRHFDVEGYQFLDYDLVSLSNLPHLSSLKASGCSFPAIPTRAFSKGSCALSHLEFRDCLRPPSLEFLPRFSSLRALKLSLLFIDRASFDFDWVPPSLTLLELCNFSFESLAGLASLSNLRALSLTDHAISSFQSSDFAQFSLLLKLQHLELPLTPEMIREFALSPSDFSSGFSALSRLTQLSIPAEFERSRRAQSPVNFLSLLGPLSGPRLEALHIGAQAQEPDSWARLPSRFPSLTELRFTGLAKLPLEACRALASLSSLRRLSLRSAAEREEFFEGRKLSKLLKL